MKIRKIRGNKQQLINKIKKYTQIYYRKKLLRIEQQENMIRLQFKITMYLFLQKVTELNMKEIPVKVQVN